MMSAADIRTDPAGTDSGGIVENEILARVNEARVARGLSVLSHDALLSEVARDYSRRMAEQEFFSHTCPDPQLRSPSDRVRVAGGQHPGIGENIAMHPSESATAACFVEGWMKSPGHRDNLLTPDWEVSGVGTYRDAHGMVLATQLFGVSPKLLVDTPTMEVVPSSWYSVRITAKIGRAHSLGAFVRNRFAGSANADRSGVTTLQVEIPAEAGQYHVSFGRKHRDSESGWISVYEGTADVSGASEATWRQGPPAQAGCVVLEESFYRISGADIVVSISGRALVPAICVVDGERKSEITPGEPLRQRLSFRRGTGVRRIDLGLPKGDGRYLVYRSFAVDTETGSIEIQA